MRAFIGIELPDKLKDMIGKKLSYFKKGFKGFRWVDDRNLHITLKFLGEVSQEKSELIIKKLEGIEFSPFRVSLSDFGFFPNIRYPRVFYIGIRDEEKNILKLYKKIETILKKIGFEKEKKTLIPHITLARKRKKEDVFIDRGILDEVSFVESIDIDSFVLFESILGREGAVYRKIKVFP